MKYMCYICNREDEYDEDSGFCYYCGNRIDKSIADMESLIINYEEEILKFNKKSDELIKKYNNKSVALKQIEYLKYKEYSQILDEEMPKNIKALYNIAKKYKNRINIIKDKIKKSGQTGKDVFVMDTPFIEQWDGYCKRLYPKDIEGMPVSKVHTYNAYMTNKDRRKYFAMDIMDKIYLKYENGIFLKGTSQDLNLYYSYVFGEDNELYDFFPTINVNYQGIEKYESLFEVSFSNKNNEKSMDYFMIEKPCKMKKQGNVFNLLKQGNIIFINKDEFENMKKYYDEICNTIHNTNNQNNFQYYLYLDKIYERYKMASDTE